MKQCNDGLNPLYRKPSEVKQVMQDCGIDSEHEVTDILRVMLKCPSNYEALLECYETAREKAKKYLKEHTSTQSAAEDKCVKLCADIIKQIDAKLKSVEDQNYNAAVIAASYREMMQKEEEVPFQAARQMEELLRCELLSDDKKRILGDLIGQIKAAERKRGYKAVKALQKGDSRGQAELLNRHGCFKKSSAGTSEVRLLQKKDGSITHAYKPLAREAQGGLDWLKLPKGASTMREDVSSSISDSIKTATGGALDLGFPKALVVKLDGEPGALIEGIKGDSADPEEVNWVDDTVLGTEVANKKREAIYKRCREIPDKIKADSLQNVVLSTVLTCQWDCKWGNMMVEDDGTARPIDGGTAVPTKDVVTGFMKRFGGPPTPSQLTVYPKHHPKEGQPMKQANKPMSEDKVNAILGLKADKLMEQARKRRDQLVQENPDVFTPELMKDECFDVVQASIEGAQEILRATPNITLADFAKAYEQWFVGYAKKLAGE